MSVAELVRAWKDEDYRAELDTADVPANPAGDIRAEVVVSATVEAFTTCNGYESCVHVCSAFA